MKWLLLILLTNPMPLKANSTYAPPHITNKDGRLFYPPSESLRNEQASLYCEFHAGKQLKIYESSLYITKGYAYFLARSEFYGIKVTRMEVPCSHSFPCQVFAKITCHGRLRNKT